MSSIENLILELEDDYNRVTANFESLFNAVRVISASGNPEDELQKTLRSVIGFQHKVEEDLDFVEKLAEKTKYPKRVESYAQDIITKLNSQKIVDKVKVYPDFDYLGETGTANAYGVILSLKFASNRLSAGDWKNLRILCQVAAEVVKSLRINLIEFEMEMRHIGVLTIFPIEKKVALKSRLLTNGFEEVVVSLEQAESCLTDGISNEGNRKNCISRSRDAIECFVATIRENVTKEKSEKHFYTDNTRLMKFGLYNNQMMQLIQGVYAFCSTDKGSHKFGPQEITVVDAEEAMQETYSLIEILLRHYLLWDKDKQ